MHYIPKSSPHPLEVLNKQKVFCIGLPKTGTTSLMQAIRILGYSVCYDSQNFRYVTKKQFSKDIPIVLSYKWLDKKYPGSKFVYTVRDKTSWIKSCQQHFRRTRWNPPVRLGAFGCPIFNKSFFIEAYEKHDVAVRQYFQKRSSDIIILDITHGDGWEKLCPFLGKPIPNKEFPHRNLTGIFHIWIPWPIRSFIMQRLM